MDCFFEVQKRSFEKKIALMERKVALMAEFKSFIHVLLEQRRLAESTCAAEAECLQLDPLSRSLAFASCPKRKVGDE